MRLPWKYLQTTDPQNPSTREVIIILYRYLVTEVEETEMLLLMSLQDNMTGKKCWIFKASGAGYRKRK